MPDQYGDDDRQREERGEDREANPRPCRAAVIRTTVRIAERVTRLESRIGPVAIGCLDPESVRSPTDVPGRNPRSLGRSETAPAAARDRAGAKGSARSSS